MLRRRHAVHAHRHAARLGNLGVTFGPGRHAAVARLGACEASAPPSSLRVLRLLGEAHGSNLPSGGAAAEVAAAQLPDQIAAHLAVIARMGSFAGVVAKPPIFAP